MKEALFMALSAGLSLWNTKEARKYRERVLELKKEWYEEFNKPIPDNASLDGIELELRHIAESFYTQTGTKDA